MSDGMTDDQRARLPKAAQLYIGNLEMRMRELQKAIDERDGKLGPSNVARIVGMDEIDMPRDTHVRFRLSKHWADKIDASLHNDARGSYVRIAGCDQITVSPCASNVVEVRLTRLASTEVA